MDILKKIEVLIKTNLNNKQNLLKGIEEFMNKPLRVEDFESVYVPGFMMNVAGKNSGEEYVIKHFKEETSLKMFVLDYLSRENILHSEDLRKLLEAALSNSATAFANRLKEEPKKESTLDVDNIFNKPRGPLN